jgi:hypothetical protein
MPNYQVFVNGQGQGPYTPDQLLQYGLNAETLVWTDGMPQWTPARLVPELAARLGVPMSSPATMPAGAYSARPSKPGAALKWCSFGTMLVGLLCFFGPFFNITCAGQRLMTVSGVDLATKTESEVKNPVDGSGTGRKEQNPVKMLALVALVVSLIGVGAAFLPQKAGPTAVIGCALVAVIVLFLCKGKIDDAIKPKLEAENKSAFGDGSTSPGSSAAAALGGARVIQLEYGIGFFGPVAMDLAALALGIVWLVKKPPEQTGIGQNSAAPA